jgi:dTDP-4-amino-4,6-dideoxygalactose transaminase
MSLNECCACVIYHHAVSFYEAYKWPIYGEEELEAVTRVLRSNQLFAKDEVRKFEVDFEKYTGASNAIGVMNATAGLHLVLAAMGIGRGHEVIVTPYSWISTASCILMQNAVPIFCDIEGSNFGLDPNQLSKHITKKTKAIILTHVFGYPARINEILDFAKENKILVIEDASHAHGSYFEGKHLGTFGDAGVFSLHQRKNLSVGDGGIITVKAKELAEKIRRLRSFGDHELSYNYRMTEFAAAIGRVRLKHLEAENQIRRNKVERIGHILTENVNFSVRKTPPDSKCSYHALLIEILANVRTEKIDETLVLLQNKKIPIRKTWEPLQKHPHFDARNLSSRGIPWKEYGYDGVMANEEYANLDLPVVNYYCPNRLLELYVHPTIPDSVFDNLDQDLNLMTL